MARAVASAAVDIASVPVAGPRLSAEDLEVSFEAETERPDPCGDALQDELVQSATAIWSHVATSAPVRDTSSDDALPDAFAPDTLQLGVEGESSESERAWRSRRKQLVRLVRRGRASGCVSEMELVDALHENFQSLDSLAAVMRLLADFGIEVAEGSPSDQQASLASPLRWSVTSEDLVDAELSPESTIGLDLSAFYLAEPAEVPLLSRDGERELAQSIMFSRDSWLKAVSSSAALVTSLKEVLQCAQREDIRVYDLFDSLNQQTAHAGDGAEALKALLRATDDDENPDSNDESQPAFLPDAISICTKLVDSLASGTRPSDSQQARDDFVRLLGNARVSAFAMQRTLATTTAKQADTESRAKATLHVSRVIEARTKLVEANLRLVLWVARKYRWSTIPLQDLVQEGNIGLMKAVDKFDGQKETKFSTYATWWIRQSITRSIGNDSRTVRLPVHIHEAASKVLQVHRKLSDGGSRPALETIAAQVGVSTDRVRRLLSLISEQLNCDTWQGEMLTEPSDDGEVEAVYPEEVAEFGDASAFAEALDLEATIRSVLAELPDREADVIRQRFGIGTDHERTLEDVGREYGVTRERIRQIEVKAFRMLRHPSRSAVLAELLDADVQAQSAMAAENGE